MFDSHRRVWLIAVSEPPGSKAVKVLWRKAMTASRTVEGSASRSRQIRESLGHPIIDADGHTIDLLPVLIEILRDVGGPKMVERFKSQNIYQLVVHHEMLASTLAERRYDGRVYDAWWAGTARTLDRATAMLPGLLKVRMEEIGIDFSILFPSETGIVHAIQDDELRQAGCRAHNIMSAELFGPHSHHMAATALIPMRTPAEAIAELEFAVGELGLKAVNLGGSPPRRIRKLMDELPEAAPYATRPEVFGMDSEYDYDPVWAKCEVLGVAPCFHGRQRRHSTSSYVFNHLGAFAQSNEAICKALLMGGVTRRFPNVNFGFLEGGAAWASSLFSDLISHWEKRGGAAIERLDPARVDVEEMLALLRTHGEPRQRDRIAEVETYLRITPPKPEYLDEFAACKIARKEDFHDLFAPRFFFGCEADAPMDSCAFNPKVNPFGAKLQAMLGSDIGHWDVPDIREVVEEAFEMVEHELISRDDFRAFTFENAVRLHGGMNPAFFAGTSVEKEAEAVLAGAGRQAAE
jgi:predicted TIM-barrel fold metal-dependent hydrolase